MEAMGINETEVRLIVEKIVKQLGDRSDASPFEADEIDGGESSGLFTNIESAIDAAEAYFELHKLSLEYRKEMIRQIRKAVMSNLELLSRMAVEETTFGRVEDKIESIDWLLSKHLV